MEIVGYIILMVIIIFLLWFNAYWKSRVKRINKKMELLLIENTLLYQWNALKRNNMFISSYFEMKGYKKIAIYGMSEFGIQLFWELKQQGKISVEYAIDQSGFCVDNLLVTYGIQEKYEPVDAIVICIPNAYESIKTLLLDKVSGEILSIMDVVNDCCQGEYIWN